MNNDTRPRLSLTDKQRSQGKARKPAPKAKSDKQEDMHTRFLRVVIDSKETVEIDTVDGTRLTCIVTDCDRYWVQAKINDGSEYIISKGAIVTISKDAAEASTKAKASAEEEVRQAAKAAA